MLGYYVESASCDECGSKLSFYIGKAFSCDCGNSGIVVGVTEDGIPVLASVETAFNMEGIAQEQEQEEKDNKVEETPSS